MTELDFVPLRFVNTGLCFERDCLVSEVNASMSKLWDLLADQAVHATAPGLALADLEQFSVWFEDNLFRARGIAPDLEGHAADWSYDLARGDA